ncbi:hypothetical protein NPIL_666191 [Nephila pilipes]|uniref:Uncharacterized protein n=1 Tax=Nephila pilipes TaxID=299642 RepID=A0A8X6TDG0_NEPPI|nr:hypothetical protein NPIL_666191 [Nephila pilipes]
MLSPILFSLYKTDIEKIITERCEFGVFAEDIALRRPNPAVNIFESQIDFNLLNEWKFGKNTNQFSFPPKYIASLFTTDRRLFKYDPRAFMNDILLLLKRHPKYLNFVLNLDLACNKYVDVAWCRRTIEDLTS